MSASGDILTSYLSLSQQISRLFRNHLSRLRLTFPQALVLTVLGEEGSMPISQLAERTGSANSTVSGIVDRLEKLNLVQRRRSDQDRRVVYVAATDQYAVLRAHAETNVAGYFSTLLAPLSPEEQSGILSSFQTLDTVLRQVNISKDSS